MRLTKRSQTPDKVSFFALTDHQIPQVHQVLHCQVVTLGQLGRDKFFDLGPQLRLSTGKGRYQRCHAILSLQLTGFKTQETFAAGCSGNRSWRI
jgi:hypothetical protein